MFSKALFALSDLIIYQKLKKLPKNHNERFRILEEYFPELYKITDELFKDYTDAYSKPVLKETCEKIENGIKNISENFELSERIKELVK